MHAYGKPVGGKLTSDGAPYAFAGPGDQYGTTHAFDP
jgi:hypothetical protein